jgi:hypothetical protein
MKVIAIAFASLLAAFAAHAEDTGFASSHDLRKEGGKTCMSEHAHFGSGDGATKDLARRAAIKSWFEYTAWEYGADWARWGKSASQSVKYTKAEKGWTADVESRPCK